MRSALFHVRLFEVTGPVPLASLWSSVPGLMTLHFSVRGVNCRRPGIALFCLLAPLSLHTKAAAQDVAEAARQQRAQKSQQPSKTHHVYTEEDLKRARILTSEDQQQAEARRKALPAPATANPPSLDATNPPAESLGEIARRYRKEKAARDAEVATSKKPPWQFRIELPATALAEPKRSISPLRVPPSAAAPSGIAPSPGPSRRAGMPARVSPFQPRPTLVSPVYSAQRANPATIVGSGNFQQIQVQPGDSLWRMARRCLGEGSRWQELLALNPGLAAHPDSIAAGSVVIVPGAAKSRSAPGAPPTITVHPGDTLWSLAHVHLGHGSDWPRIAHANPQLSDYLRLQVGARLRLPPG